MNHQGPEKKANLAGLLLRFWKQKIAVLGDVVEIFMEVVISENDCRALQLLRWSQGDMSLKPREYQMTAYPLGARSSPFFNIHLL